MPTTGADCLPYLHALDPGKEIWAGCLQADATRRAAEITAHATIHSGWLTLFSAFFAVLSAGAVLLSASMARITEKEVAQEAQCARTLRVASSYASEISSLEAYLKENDVVGTLRAKAEQSTRMYFHPGDSWLLTYKLDPSSVGHFETALSGPLVSYYCKMLNELGRLRWLHKMTDEEVVEMGMPALCREMTSTANTLQRLIVDGLELQGGLRQCISNQRATQSKL